MGRRRRRRSCRWRGGKQSSQGGGKAVELQYISDCSVILREAGMRLMRSIPVALAVLILAARFAAAQPLADRLPSDALLYIGWAGSDKLGEAYSKSHLKGVLD